MSENACAFCKIATGEEELEIVHGEERVALHSVGGARWRACSLSPRITSPRRRRSGCYRRVG